jgi:DNA-binding NarL/FixJ family response regulator
MEKKQIFLIDRHAITREGLRCVIERQPDLMVCGDSQCCQSCRPDLIKLKPDLVVMEAFCHTGFRTDAIVQLRQQSPRLGILVVSTGADVVYAERCLRAGASGYLSKDHSVAEILDGIRKVLRGEIAVAPSISNAILNKWAVGDGARITSTVPVELFTDRELEVFQLIGEGHGTGQVAKKLNLSVSTVETYRQRLKEKLNLATGAELVRCAVCWVQGSGGQQQYHI